MEQRCQPRHDRPHDFACSHPEPSGQGAGATFAVLVGEQDPFAEVRENWSRAIAASLIT